MGEHTAAAMYRAAHEAHYKNKDLERARAGYERVIDRFPDSPEARYARTQLGNLERAENPKPMNLEPVTLEGKISAKFVCTKCGSKKSQIKRVAMTGDGLSRLVDVQRHFYLAVTCADCAYTDFFDLNLLEGRGSALDSVIDLIFGG